MRAMVSSDIGGRWSNRRPRRVVNSVVARDPIRVGVRTKRGRNGPWGLLNKETICCGRREKREESGMAFAKIDRDHLKNRGVVRH